MTAATINIFSGEKGLGGALTNPTKRSKEKGSIVQDYPVTFEEVNYVDAETAYQHAKLTRPKMKMCELELLMSAIIEAKLRQHPRLKDTITKNGGVLWLEQCSHKTGARSPRFRRWEGVGTKSAFIRALITGYQKSLESFVPQPISGESS